MSHRSARPTKPAFMWAGYSDSMLDQSSDQTFFISVSRWALAGLAPVGELRR